MKVCDLFAGVGGLSLPFKDNIVYANDIDEKCKLTYDLNHKIPLTVKDIRDVEEKDIPEHDLLLAGFPCQSFSISGNKKGFEDDRGILFFEIIRILKYHKPRYIILENVKNIVTHDKGNTLKTILKELNQLGYYVKYQVLNAYIQGNLPQNRERIFICCFRNKKDYELFNFPDKVPLTCSFKDYLEENVDKCHYYDNKKIYEKIKEDITSEDKVYQYRRYYVRENKTGVCPTLTANMGTGGHNVPLILQKGRIRRLTPKECFLLQGFPKSFILPDIALSHLYKQAGNSVPVSVVEKIAMKIFDIYKYNELSESESDDSDDLGSSSDESSSDESESE